MDDDDGDDDGFGFGGDYLLVYWIEFGLEEDYPFLCYCVVLNWEMGAAEEPEEGKDYD